jgi:hypothetical protein
MKLFRPNLENPANKEVTMELNTEETKRCEYFKDVSLSNFFYFFYS